MHIHILGIGGTFMGGVAALAQASGHTVTGQDKKLYPPMSTQLENLGIEVHEYSPDALPEKASVDMVIVGNVMSRGYAVVEALLDSGIPYVSGPQWLAEHILEGRWVLAAAGTHGKTTTSSMLAWILEYAGLCPGFLIGGVPRNFSESARLGQGEYFVVEADEYDSAFFDKRSKFVHYRPRTLILNNLEFDHADIFPDIASIQKQFHHLIRTVPGQGRIVHNALDKNLDQVLEMGCWSETAAFRCSESENLPGWAATERTPHEFEVYFQGELCGKVSWPLLGQHNVMNALAAIAAAHHAGVDIATACNALHAFQGVKRRLEKLFSSESVRLYDDFAHHPTAIETTLQGLRKAHPDGRLIAVFDPHSNTMKRGEHNQVLASVFSYADQVFVYNHADLQWDIEQVFNSLVNKLSVFTEPEQAVESILAAADSDENHIVLMSNGGFAGIKSIILSRLNSADRMN